jgi:predicted phage tail component-like protein
MHYGFTWKGIHSGTHGIFMRSNNRTVTPTRRRHEFIIPGRDGVIEILGGFEQRKISIMCTILRRNLPELRQSVRNIGNWLSGSGVLVFDDEPGARYNASITEGISLHQFGTNGEFTVIFNCAPFPS